MSALAIASSSSACTSVRPVSGATAVAMPRATSVTSSRSSSGARSCVSIARWLPPAARRGGRRSRAASSAAAHRRGRARAARTCRSLGAARQSAACARTRARRARRRASRRRRCPRARSHEWINASVVISQQYSAVGFSPLESDTVPSSAPGAPNAASEPFTAASHVATGSSPSWSPSKRPPMSATVDPCDERRHPQLLDGDVVDEHPHVPVVVRRRVVPLALADRVHVRAEAVDRPPEQHDELGHARRRYAFPRVRRQKRGARRSRLERWRTSHPFDTRSRVT